MAKSRNRKKKKKAPVKQVKLKPENYIKKLARRLPIKECRINEYWDEEMAIGLVQITVAREKRNGALVVGVYLVDKFCLGLKNTMAFHNMEVDDYEGLLEKMEETLEDGESMVSCEPNIAFNIVYGGVKYASDLGFSPNKDYRVSQYVLEPESKIEPISIEFGKEGKPYYFAGPFEDHFKMQQIIAQLNDSVGEGNYEFVLYNEEDEMDELFLQLIAKKHLLIDDEDE